MRNKRMFLDDKKDFVIEKYKSGNSFRGIAKLLNCSITPIKKILYENNIDTKKNRWDYFERSFTKNEEWLFNEFITKGRNSYDIAKELGITQAGLHYWITKFNINRNRLSPSEETRKKIKQTLKMKHKTGELVISKKAIEKSIECHSKKSGSITHLLNGYNLIKINKKQIYEHYYIWKRDSDWSFIPQGFVVHHINQNKSDNRIENLACIPRNIHSMLHKKMGCST